MKYEVYNGHRITYYDGDIAELPAERFNKFNKFIMLDANLGSDLQDLNERINRIRAYIKKEPEKAESELNNFQQSIQLIFKGINPSHLAACALITEVDGIKYTEVTDQSIMQVYDKLKHKLPHAWFARFLKWVKKKIDTELEAYYPGQFSDARTNEYYEKVRKRILLVCEGIQKGELPDTSQLDYEILTFVKPLDFAGPKNPEIRHEKNFADLCFLIGKEMGGNPKKLPVLDFYQALETIKKIRHGRKSNKNKRPVRR